MSACAKPARESAVDVTWSAVLRALCAHRADTPARLTAYLDAHPTDVAALCLQGFAQLFLGRADRRPAAAVAEAAALAAIQGDTPRERRLIEALSAWRHDRPRGAVAALDAQLADDPRDLLTLKIQHGLLLMLGQPQRMRTTLERVLPAWRADTPETGFVLGCYAFSLEETGAFDLAETVGRRAVAMQSDDAWAIHAVAHVFESLGRAREGLDWLDAHADGYAECNVFRGHVHWHRALLHFQLEDFAAALSVYDAHVATPWAGDYRDMSNAVSLLWRLESEGVNVGSRWRRLAEIAEAHIGDEGSAFAMAHYALALARGDARARLSKVLASAPEGVPLEPSPDSQQAIVREVAFPLCRGIEAWCAGDAASAYETWRPIEAVLPRMGGSNAQRDLFTLMLVDAALATGRADTAQRLVADRQRLRPHDPWLARRTSVAG